MPDVTYLSNVKKYGQADPRKDKAQDHGYWETLLCLCGTRKGYEQIYWNLHAFRCGGAEIVPTVSSLRIERGEWSVEVWEEKKLRYLEPERKKLVEILRITRSMTPKGKGGRNGG